MGVGGTEGVRVLEVNMTDCTVQTRSLPPDVRRTFLGGSGLAAYLLMGRADYTHDPLSPDSAICIAPGLLTGYSVPAASKASICARSPLTGCWNESTVGGKFGAGLKGTGYDAIVVTGRAKSWSYLWIDERGAEVRGAESLFGKDTYETESAISEAVGDDVQVACIGPAGERLLPISGVVIGGRSARLAARGGIGAVFGSKRLKAVVAPPAKRLNAPQSLALRNSVLAAMPAIRAGCKRLTDYGTGGGVTAREAIGDLPIRNWLGSKWPAAGDISGQKMAEIYRLKNYSCFSCPIACGKVITDESGSTTCHAPEYETLAALGSLCDVADVRYVVEANDYCNRMGLDTISAGAAVAFAMEASEKGLLPGGSPPVEWGSGESMLSLLEDMVEGKGLGGLINKGTRQAALTLGSAAADLSVDCKGMEIPMHDPRAFTSMAVGYATAVRGGCHLESMGYSVEGGRGIPEIGLGGPYQPTENEGKAALAKSMQDLMSAYNALGLCKFLLSGKVGASLPAEWTSLVTGWEFGVADLMLTGERLFNLRRMYNLASGVGPEADTLPRRLLTLPKRIGGREITLQGLPQMLDEYRRLRRWDADGFPTPALLDDLGLSGIVDTQRTSTHRRGG